MDIDVPRVLFEDFCQRLRRGRLLEGEDREGIRQLEVPCVPDDGCQAWFRQERAREGEFLGSMVENLAELSSRAVVRLRVDKRNF